MRASAIHLFIWLACRCSCSRSIHFTVKIIQCTSSCVRLATRSKKKKKKKSKLDKRHLRLVSFRQSNIRKGRQRRLVSPSYGCVVAVVQLQPLSVAGTVEPDGAAGCLHYRRRRWRHPDCTQAKVRWSAARKVPCQVDMHIFFNNHWLCFYAVEGTKAFGR